MSLVLNGSSYAWRAALVSAAPFTVAGWFKSTSDSTFQGVWSQGLQSATTEYWILRASGASVGDPVQAVIRHTATAAPVTTTGYTTNRWHHAMFVEAGVANHKVYIDGGSEGSDVTSLAPAGTNKMAVGAMAYNAGWSNYFLGKLAQIAVWDIALGADDRAALAGGASPSTIQPAHLIAYWPLFDDVNDDSGHAYNLTNVGGTFDTADSPSVSIPVDLYGVGGVPDWEALEDLPEAKDQHGFEECGGKLYAVCGVTTGDVHSKKAYAFDPSTGHWAAIADAPRSLQSPILRSVGGKLYLMGGYRSDLGIHYDNVTEFDPATGNWTEKAAMPQAVEDFGSAVINNEIWIFGGLYNNSPYQLRPYIDVYNPATNSWRNPSIAWATPRCLGDYCCNYNGKIYVIGGTADMSGYSAHVNGTTAVYEYNPATDAWVLKSPISIARTYHEIAELDGILYTVAGRFDGVYDWLKTVESYEVALNKWKSVQAKFLVDIGGCGGSGLASYDGSLYLCGGRSGTGPYTYLDQLYKYTPASCGSASGTLTQDLAPAPVGPARYNAFNIQLDQNRV